MRTKPGFGVVCALSCLVISLLFASTTARAQDIDDIGEAVGEIFGQLFFPQPAAPAIAPAPERVVGGAVAEEPVADGPGILELRIDEGVPAAEVQSEVTVQAEVAVEAGAAVFLAPPANDIDEQVKQLRAQFIQQYQPILTTELYFLRKVCHPNKQQGKKLSDAGKAALDEAGQQMADMQGKMMRGQFAVFPGNDAYPDPRKVIREGLSVAAKSALTPEQIAMYEKELGGRTAARKRTMVRYLVAKLDSDLALTADQRKKLVESLSENWQDNWDQTVEMVMYGENYLPAIPDHLVQGVLTADQFQIWQSGNRNRNQVMGGFFPGFAVMNAGAEWGIEWEEDDAADGAAPDNAAPDNAAPDNAAPDNAVDAQPAAEDNQP